MDILLLGGTGWLSGELARLAVADGHTVTALTRGRNPVPDGVAGVRGDRAEEGAYDAVAGRDWDLVVDVAWQPGQVRSAVEALDGRAARWVYVSSGSVYRATEEPVGDEGDPLHDPFDADVAEGEDYAAAKVACEQAVLAGLGDRAVIARAGLIGGHGDPSDRFGYYPAAFARADGEPVLVPALGAQPVQCISHADLARWLLEVGASADHGTFDAYGELVSFEDLVQVLREVTGHRGEVIEAEPEELLAHEIGYFMGPRSLPLWLPAGHELTVPRPCARARDAGLTHRGYRSFVAEVLDDERARGLDRPRRSGLSRAEETELIAGLA